MKNQEIQKLNRKYISPTLEGYVASGHLLVYTPVDFLLRGYCFEGSNSTHDQFTVSAFVQPLYVPSDRIVLSYGKRLGIIVGKPEKWWEIDPRNASNVMQDVLNVIQMQAEPILKLFTTPQSFIDNLSKLHDNEKDLYRNEAIAYSFVLERDLLQARKAFIRLMPGLDQMIAKGVPWVRALQDRAQLILRHVELGDVEAAIAQLKEWKKFTSQRLLNIKSNKINKL